VLERLSIYIVSVKDTAQRIGREKLQQNQDMETLALRLSLLTRAPEVTALVRQLAWPSLGGGSRIAVSGTSCGEAKKNRRLQAMLEGNGVKCRFVDGVKDLQPKQLIGANVQWADLTVLWSGTRLPHKLCNSYRAAARGRTEVISLAHPGMIRMGPDVTLCLSNRRKR